MWWWLGESEGHIHGIFDRCHGERIEELESVEEFEPAEQACCAEDFKMAPETIM